jgi:hypothetical protein
MKDGPARERAEAARALRKAQAIMRARIKRIKDEKILASIQASVPLARELSVSSGKPTPKPVRPRTASKQASVRPSATAGRKR